MIIDYNYFLSECNRLILRLLYQSNQDFFMITNDYFPWVTLFLVGEYIIMHVSSLCHLQRNMNEKKYVVTSELFF